MSREKIFSQMAGLENFFIEPFNPQKEIIFNPEQATTFLGPATDLRLSGLITPMVQAAFLRYTFYGNGNDKNGNPVVWKRDIFDESPGKAEYAISIQDNVVLGAVRVVRSWIEPIRPAAIDAMNLMTGHDWPSIKIRFGEVGHFCLHPQIRRKEGLEIQRQLYEKVMELAQEEGFAQHIYVILSYTKKFVEDSNIRVELFPEAKLNWNNPQAQQIFEDFPRYWQPEQFPEYWKETQAPFAPQLYYYGVGWPY